MVGKSYEIFILFPRKKLFIFENKFESYHVKPQVQNIFMVHRQQSWLHLVFILLFYHNNRFFGLNIF
jgi:hypothetical protein